MGEIKWIGGIVLWVNHHNYYQNIRNDISLFCLPFSSFLLQPVACECQETEALMRQRQRPLRSWGAVVPPRVLLLCRSWGACVPRRPQRLCQLESWLLVGLTMLDRLCGRGQTKCNTPLMLATSAFGRISPMTLLCDVPVKVQTGHSMAQWRGMHGSVPCAFCHADTHYPVM